MARRTQAVIMQAFMELLARKPYDKITVKEVIERADINRNTFYYYYENIPSLLEALFDQEIQAFSNSTEKSDSFAKEYMRASSLVRTNRQALRHLYESENRALISQFLETASGLFVERFVRQAAAPYGLSEDGIYYVTRFYSYAIVGLTMHWIRADLPSVVDNLPERLEGTFYASINSVIEDYLKFQAKGTGE